MKVFVCLAVAFVACNAAGFRSAGPSASFKAFKAAHGKTYSAAEEASKEAQFRATHDFIQKHNERFARGLESFHVEHNEFSDMSLEEMKTRMGVIVPANVEQLRANATQHTMVSGYAAPDSYDLRRIGGVTNVKNQGGCGSCYSFSASGALESAEFIRNRKVVDVSEQNIVDCTYRGKYGNQGCGGGWMWAAYSYIKDVAGNGINHQHDYRYEGQVGSCRHVAGRPATRLTGHVIINKGDENAIQNALLTNGAVSIAYNAGTQQHAAYRGGIIDVPNCGNTPTHATLIVGYGVENGRQYWIVKNSWGNGWGESGYFRLARGKNMCGVADWASYPIALAC